ncbi:hypothetical protein COO60DRAFT_612102 [Scenedesmus sp. NREL 46B-D3]|nr:hypothetical protein COO60DRAFT_612102 [Scenedesmus sp. NREL 46B-D3]
MHIYLLASIFLHPQLQLSCCEHLQRLPYGCLHCCIVQWACNLWPGFNFPVHKTAAFASVCGACMLHGWDQSLFHLGSTQLPGHVHRSQSALSAILLFNSTGCAQGSAGTPSSLLCSDEFHHTAGLFVSGPPGHSSCVHSCCSAKYLWMGLSPVTVRIVIGTLVYFSSLECVCCKTHAQ